MRYLFCYLTYFLLLIQGFSQTTFCPDDPPINPYLADSPWPIYHRNNFAQASTCLPGPMAGDSLVIRARTNIQGGTSPWVYLSDTYSTGERVLLQSNSTHVFKFLDTGTEILALDSLRIDFDPIASFGWNFLLTTDHVWFTYDPKYDPDNDRTTRLFKLTDADVSDPYSDIILLDTFDFGDYGINRVQHFSINYDGHLVFNSENDVDSGYATTGIISQDFMMLDTLRYTTLPNEIVRHNAFPIDENNSYYIVTTHRLIRFDWDGQEVSMAWEADYDFVGDGPTGSFAEGSGTTPTLLGWGERDQLVVMADGHANNHLVAFWRELPDGWTGVSGMDIHFADSIQIPLAQSFSNLFQSIENSPTAFGYDIAIAQFNGFLGYDCTNLKSVQKISWDTLSNQFSIAWATDSVNMNGVLTYSEGSNLLYGSGKEEDCNYYYYGLNWETGDVELRILLGPEGSFVDDPYYDAGNNNIIDDQGNIYFPGGGSLVKVEVVARDSVSTSTSAALASASLEVYPNPAHDELRINYEWKGTETLSIYDIHGQQQSVLQRDVNVLDISSLPSGIYVFKLASEGRESWKKFVKG